MQGPQDGPAYSTAHLDFKKWKRTEDCCTASGKEIAISSGGQHSSRIGLEIAKRGGNVIDVAVAVAFALAVERPHSAGLGGGGFMTVYLSEPNKTVSFVDFRETAPHRATRDMFLDDKGNVLPGFSQKGAFSVATPGFVAGMYEIHKKWGKLPWRTVLNPSIILATGGFRVYPSLSEKIQARKAEFARIPYAQSIFLQGSRELRPGQAIYQADLGKTIRAISRGGRDVFYKGWIADRIIRSMAPYGGILEAKDFQHYEVRFREPVQFDWHGYQIYTAPPPSAGGVMIAQMMKVLEPFKLKEVSQKSGGYVHLLAETMKRAYADRSRFVGDPDFVKFPYPSLYSDSYVSDLRSDLNLSKSTPSSEIAPGNGDLDLPGTTHLSVIDSKGNSVSATLTINGSFGSGIVVPETGIVLNNEMDDFSIKPGEKNLYGLTGGEANAIAAGKRPVSSMSPTIVVGSKGPVLALGGAGGSRIISNTFQVMLNFLAVYDQDLKKAVFAPRMHHQWLPDQLDLEPGFPESAVTYLKSLDNQMTEPKWRARISAVGIGAEGSLTAVFDPRDNGGAYAK